MEYNIMNHFKSRLFGRRFEWTIQNLNLKIWKMRVAYILICPSPAPKATTLGSTGFDTMEKIPDANVGRVKRWLWRKMLNATTFRSC